MAVRIKLCKSLSAKYQVANHWFASLINQVGPQERVTPQTQAGLEFCVDSFHTYAQTGDERFLTLCEDFLKYTLATTQNPMAKAT